jgi:Holliday junction resolvase RusA-like endonuclease
VITFQVPGRPQGKGRPRFSRETGTAYTPSATKAYERKVAFFARRAMLESQLRPYAKDIPLCCKVAAMFSVPASWSQPKQQAALAGTRRPTGKPDGDNILKAVADGLNGVAWHDDAQVVHWTMSKRYGSIDELVVIVGEVA